MLYRIAVCVVMLSIFAEGSTIASLPGENKILRWTLDPIPSSDNIVSVIHQIKWAVGGGATLFSVQGKIVIPLDTDIAKRVTNTGNTNTVTGNIEFTLTDIIVGDAGEYITRYSLDTGVPTADYVGVRLVVYVKPSKPIIMEEAVPVVGRTMILKCSTTSNSKPDGHGLQMNYKWYMNGADLPSNDRYVISGSHLKMQIVQKSDEDKQFMCVVSENITLSSNTSYTVHVKYGPDFVSPSIEQQHRLEENKNTLQPITCSAHCKPDCQLKWKFNGAVIDTTDNTLTISNIKRASAGTYWCVASNDYGTKTSKNVSVTVVYKPDTPELSKSIDGVVSESDRLSLNCTTDSIPLSDIIITSSNAKEKDYVSHGKLNSTLTIQKADCLDTGKYVCSANNTIGRASSNPVMVNVTCSPRLDGRKDLQSHIYIGDKDILNITATVIANPPPVLSWIFKDDTDITLRNNTNGFVYYKDTKHITYTSRAVKSQMKNGDYGQYVLKASNSLGVTQVTFYVSTKSSPDSPYNAIIDCDEQMTATVKWRSNFNGGETQRFLLKSITDSGIHLYIADKGINLLHEAKVTNLKPDTFYSFVIEAHNNNGWSAFEHFLNCTTKASSLPLQDQSMFKAGIGMLVTALICLGAVIVLTIYNLRRIRSTHQTQNQSPHYDDIPSGTRSESTEQDNTAYVEMDHQRNDTYEGLGTRENPTIYDKLKPGRQQTETSGPQYMNTMLH